MLPLVDAVSIFVHNRIGAPGSIVLDADGVARRAQLEVTSRLGARNLCIKRRPLGPDRAAVHAESDLQAARPPVVGLRVDRDRKSTRLNSSHSQISYAVFCLKHNTAGPAPRRRKDLPPGPANVLRCTPRDPLSPRRRGLALTRATLCV